MSELLSPTEHDQAVRFIAANRFPFPDQPHPSWPLDYVTLTNTATHRRRAIEIKGEMHYPDIVIIDGKNGIREIAEIETHLSPEFVARWRAASLAADDTTKTGARHLLIYVPKGLEEAARELLESNDISYHALRAIEVMPDGMVHIYPHRTLGNDTDHRLHVPPSPEADPVVTELDREAHNAVMRWVVAERFPFPGESTESWAIDYRAVLNTHLHQRLSIDTPTGPYFPDIVVIDGQGTVCKIGEVETAVDESCVAHWRIGSATAALEGRYHDPENDRPAKHFLLYVPAGQEGRAQALVREHRISTAGIRGYEVTKAGRVRLVTTSPPIVPDAA